MFDNTPKFLSNDTVLSQYAQTATSVLDKDMNIIHANKSFCDRSSKKLINVIGDKCCRGTYGRDELCSECPVQKCFLIKTPAHAVHNFWVDNHAIVERVLATPVFDDDNEVIAVVEEFQDITELLGLKNGVIAICSYCKKTCDENNEWKDLEHYIAEHTGCKFSHGVCEQCKKKLLKDEWESKSSPR